MWSGTEVKTKATETILKYNLLGKRNRLLIGVSGGMDSISLLHFLANFDFNMKLDLYGCHINHGIRGEDANRDEIFVRDFCECLGVKLFVHKIDVPQIAKDQKISIEECARNIRYQVFEEYAKELGSKIVTAHTLNDSMETVFINISRGTGLRGLCGITPVRGNIIRPLIFVPRRQIERYMNENKLPHVEDKTNSETKYTRNFVRHYIIPKFYELNGAFETVFERMCLNLRKDEEFLEQHAKNSQIDVDLESDNYRLQKIKLLPDCLKFRVIKQILRQYKVPYEQKKIKLIKEMLDMGSGKLELKKGVYANVANEVFSLQQEEKPQPELPISLKVDIPGVYNVFNGKQVEFTILNRKEYDCLKNKMDIKANVLAKDKITKFLKLRTKKNGDKIKLNRYGCTKTLKKLFLEHKIPAQKREKYLLLQDELDLIWVENFGPAQRVAVSVTTEQIILVVVTQTPLPLTEN